MDTEGLLIHVLGSGPAVEAHPQRRVNIFRGRGARVVRLLLAAPAAVPNIRALSRAAELSYARTHDVVQVLAREGFIERLAGHGGVRLRDPVGLLRAWVSSEDPSAASVERFNLRSTTDHTLRAGFERLEARGVRAVFSLASAVPEDARWVTALPHGLYTTATRGVLEEAFELRTHPPHNFLVLRPDPPADTDKGGVYTAARSLAAGPAVFIPQLIVDLHRHGGGRGGEQADRLLEQWSSALPLSSVTDEAAQ